MKKMNALETTRTLNAALAQMKSLEEFSHLFGDVQNDTYSLPEEEIRILHETFLMTLRKKLARMYTLFLGSYYPLPLTEAFREKLIVYLALSADFAEDDFGDDAFDSKTATSSGSSVTSLVTLYEMTKAAATSDKEGELFPCLQKLLAALDAPQTRSAAACCLRHLEDSLCDQILAKGAEMNLGAVEPFASWVHLYNVLQDERCHQHPKEYFQALYYDPDQKEFGFDSNSFFIATSPF